MRADEQHAAAAVAEPRVGVQQVRRAVQRDDGLAGAGAAVDDERAAGAGADDGVLVGLDRAEHVAHPRRPAAAEAGDERGLVVERGGVALEPVGGEHLVPVVADPAAGPAVAATAGQAHRVGVGRSEERLGGGGAPVDEQPAAGAVGEAEAADVDRARRRPRGPSGRGRGRGRSGAGCAAARSAGGSPGRGPAPPGRRRRAPARGSSSRSDRSAMRLLEARGDGREVLLVAGDQGRVGLGGEVVGEVERAGHGVDGAARRGSCRKPGGPLYVESGEADGPLHLHVRRSCWMARP